MAEKHLTLSPASEFIMFTSNDGEVHVASLF